jgi:hypothetical protein
LSLAIKMKKDFKEMRENFLKMEWDNKSLREILRSSKTSREAASSERGPSRTAVPNCEIYPVPSALIT